MKQQLFGCLASTLLVLSSFVSAPLYAEPSPSGEEEAQTKFIKSKIYVPAIQATEVTLKNGMRVVIKETDYDEGEVFVQLIAPGGYAALPKEYRPSGIMAAKIAKESGLGHLSSDELNYSMYRDSIELTVNIEKTHRSIDASVPSHNIESLIKVINLIFTENRLTEKAMNSVVEREKNSIRNRHLDKEETFEVMHMALNTQNSKTMKPLSLKALNRIELDKARDFYRDCFTNPEDFVVVIVGDVDPSKVIPFIDQYFGPINNMPTIKSPDRPSINPFPEGITRRHVPTRIGNDAYTRITIPLTQELNEDSIHLIQLMTLYIERELRQTMKKEIGKTNGIDVGFQLPLYPFQSPVWITINFHCVKGQVSNLETKIMDRLKELQKDGITAEELVELKKHQNQSDDFWLHDNCFWQANLLNYYSWQWKPETIASKEGVYEKVSPEVMNPFIKESMSLKNYTLLSSYPK